MFEVSLRGGDSSFNSNFRNVLIHMLSGSLEGYIFNEFDQCLFRLDDVIAYEDENGNMVNVGTA